MDGWSLGRHRIDSPKNCSYKKTIDDLTWMRNGTLFACHAHKRALNARKPGIDLIRASSVFEDPCAFSFFDAAHSDREERCAIIGRMDTEVLVYAVYTLRGDTIRLISARKATRKEAEDYAGR